MSRSSSRRYSRRAVRSNSSMCSSKPAAKRVGGIFCDRIQLVEFLILKRLEKGPTLHRLKAVDSTCD